MGQPFELKRVDATLGAVVTGVRLAEINEAGFSALYAAWQEHALLILPGQNLTREEQVAFARRFGDLEIPITPISNVRGDGSVRPPDDDVMKVLQGNMIWHADSTYMPVQAKGAVFSAQITPSRGGETGWADMRAAWDDLPAALKAKVEGLSAHHSLVYSQAKLGHAHSAGSSYSGYGMTEGGAPLRPLVKRHPETGRLSLNIGRHAHAIPGLSEAESEALLEELTDFACRPPRLWQHEWSPGDVVIWDNRCLLHRALPWDLAEPRVMHHSRIAGDPVSEAAAA